MNKPHPHEAEVLWRALDYAVTHKSPEYFADLDTLLKYMEMGRGVECILSIDYEQRIVKYRGWVNL